MAKGRARKTKTKGTVSAKKSAVKTSGYMESKKTALKAAAKKKRY